MLELVKFKSTFFSSKKENMREATEPRLRICYTPQIISFTVGNYHFLMMLYRTFNTLFEKKIKIRKALRSDNNPFKIKHCVNEQNTYPKCLLSQNVL